MADPVVVGWVKQAARQTGLNPLATQALLATSLQESGGRRGIVGDQGTSFGPFQFHIGGALGNHPPAWANTYAAVLNRATEFKRLGVQGGVGAAAVQRPAKPGEYAAGVNQKLALAAQMLNQPGVQASTPFPQSLTHLQQSAVPKLSQQTPQISPAQSAIDSLSKLLHIGDPQLPLQTTAPAQTQMPLLPAKAAFPGISSGASTGGIVNKANYAGTDQGVDFRGKGAVPAFANGVVTRVDTHSGWPGGGMVTYKITSGPHAGKFVYVAENLTPTVRVGQQVRAGQTVAVAHGAYPYTEMGWAADAQGTTLAQAQKSGYIPNVHQFATQQGQSFKSFIGI